MRRKSKVVKINRFLIGGTNRIAVQSMLNCKTSDFFACSEQMRQLRDEGCDIIRFAVPDRESAKSVYGLKNEFPDIPLVADIHFDYRIALDCIEAGIDKIRINPGNIGSEDRIKEVVTAAKRRNVPIRIGVNGGSLEKHILAKYGKPTAEAIAESAFYHVSLLEKFDFDDIVISVKSSNVSEMINANRIIANKCDYPLHLGVTEAGTRKIGTIKNNVGIGALLCEGIGDTVRVSLTDDPVADVHAAKDLLEALDLSDNLITTVSCPTCGRTCIDLIGLASEFDKIKSDLHPSKKIKVAIMGCVVNGPGEAKECDIGIAGGKDEALLFKFGDPVCKVPNDRILSVLTEEINKI